MSKLSGVTSFFLILLVVPSFCLAQLNEVSGSVLNAKTKEPLPSVNVFLDQTTIGVTTDKNGKYRLDNLPEGTYYLVFSFVGFEKFQKTIHIPRQNNTPINTELNPDRLELDNLIIKGERPTKWLKNLKRFKKHFLGYTQNAEKTKILNPEVLEFDNKDGDLIAYAETPLEIINQGLGYKITLYLQEFHVDGFYLRTEVASKFALLNSNSKKKQNLWQTERKRTYNGSFRHFIHSLVKRNLKKEGFRLVYTKERIIYPHDNQKPDRSKVHMGAVFDEARVEKPYELWNYQKRGQIRLSLKKKYNFLKVVYLKEGIERPIGFMMGIDPEIIPKIQQVSFIELPEEIAVIDVKTALSIPPYSPITYGYWGWSSAIPEWLPRDYEPPTN